MDVIGTSLMLDQPRKFSFDRGGFITYSNRRAFGGRVVKNRYYDIYNGDSLTSTHACVCVLEVIPQKRCTKFIIRDLDGKKTPIFDNRGCELRFKEVDAPTIALFKVGEEIKFDQNCTDQYTARKLLQKLVPNKLYQVQQLKRGIDSSFIFLSGSVDSNHVILTFISLKVDTTNGDVRLIAQNG